MKAGDIVHVPSEVVLIRVVSLDTKSGLESTIYFKTKFPKKAIFIEKHPVNDSYMRIEYGENTWDVNKKDVTLMEFADDY